MNLLIRLLIYFYDFFKRLLLEEIVHYFGKFFCLFI